MKKSTLITTIAMIVVVVVALSTATYAWFSSQTETKVETSITTEATSGWLLYGGSLSGTTLTYSSSIGLDWTLPSGIYSPETTIASALGGKTAITTFTNQQFYEAKVTGGENRSANGLEGDKVVPKFVRIINNEADGADLGLSIYIIVPAAAEERSFRAAAGFKTWISAYGAADNSARVLTTGYKYGDLSNSTTGEAPGYYTATRSELDLEGTSEGVVLTDTVDPASAVANSGFHQLVAGDTAILTSTGASVGDYVRRITVTVAEDMQIGTAINLAFYAWLDGWDLDDTASGVENLQIVYSFATIA